VLVYNARSKLPNITRTPIPKPAIVGQSVPDCGSVGAGVDVVEVPVQIQFAFAVQEGFLQKPL
jgi:hypothetical protein